MDAPRTTTDINVRPQPLFPAPENTIKGVEIFATGEHNGDKYTEADLDTLVESFKALDYKPALKIGHVADKPGDLALGWVENVRRMGNKLVADITHIHDAVFKAIKQRRVDRVSSEIWWNLKRGGKIYRLALKAVALLGAEIPAVAQLTPLHKLQFTGDAEADRLVFFSTAFAPEPQSPGEELDQRVREYLESSADKSYEHAVAEVLSQDSALRRSYAQQPTAQFSGGAGNAGAELHNKVKALMRAEGIESYAMALDRVLSDEPDLARQYAEETVVRARNK